MEESQIKKAYLELKDEVNKNPESLKVRQGLEELRKLVHERIIENLKVVYSDYWDKSAAYEKFLNNLNERGQMEKVVLNKEVGINFSIEDMQNQISLLIMATMETKPNAFDIEVRNETKEMNEKSKIEDKQNSNIENSNITEEYLEKNKEKIIRLIRDKKDEWFSMDKNSDFQKFCIELDGEIISYRKLAVLFLGERVLKSNNAFRVYVLLGGEIFGGETLEKWRKKIRNEILLKKNWDELEKSQDLRNDYFVNVDGATYKYKELVAIYSINLGGNKILSKEVYKDLSRAMFGIHWRKLLKTEKTVRRFRNTDTYRVEQRNPGLSDKALIGEINNTPKKDSNKIGGNNENDQEKVEKNVIRRKSKSEIEREKREKMLKDLRDTARNMLISNPKLKESWFGDNNEDSGPRTFILLYNNSEYFVRQVGIETGILGENMKLTFNQFMDKFFGKDYADAMRLEVAKNKKKQEEQLDDGKNGEKDKENIQDKAEDKIENKEEDKNENEEVSSLEKKFFVMLGEKAGMELIDFDYFTKEPLVVSCFDIIVEECIQGKKEDITKKMEFIVNKEWGKITSQCKDKYPRADISTLKVKCKNSTFIDEIKTEYLLLKQSEVREKVCDYIHEGGEKDGFLQFCSEIIRDLEQSDLDQECYDYFIDSVENQYRISHNNDEKGILDTIKKEDNEMKVKQEKEKKDKEILNFCERNDIKVSEYKVIEELSFLLKRKGVTDRNKLMKYLVKLMKKKESLREAEFEGDLDSKVIEKLDSLGISVIYKKTTKNLSVCVKNEDSSKSMEVKKKESIIIDMGEYIKGDAMEAFIQEASKRDVEIDSSTLKKQIADLCTFEVWKNKFLSTIKRDSFWKRNKKNDRYFFFLGGGHSGAFVAQKVDGKITITDWCSHDQIDGLNKGKIG